MERVLVRIELDPDTAKIVAASLAEQAQRVGIALGQEPPEHTRKALEEIRDALDVAKRELARALANPVEIDVST